MRLVLRSCAPARGGREGARSKLVVPLTVAMLLAQQVASNAIRDGLFLTWFPVTSLPYFIAAAAILAVPAAESSGRLLARFGPGRLVPVILGVNSALFLAEWSLLRDLPRDSRQGSSIFMRPYWRRSGSQPSSRYSTSASIRIRRSR